MDDELIGITDSVTSVMSAKANDSYLVSTLDSTIRLMDRVDGKMLQAFKDPAVSVPCSLLTSKSAATPSVQWTKTKTAR